MKRAWKADWALMIGPHTRQYVLALLWTGTIAFLMTALNPLATRLIFDVAVAQKRLDWLVGIAAASLIVFSLLRWWDFQCGQYQQRLTNRLSADLTQRMVAGYFRLPPASVAKHSDGYFVARTMSEVENTVTPAVSAGVQLLRAVMILVTAVVTVLILSWQLTSVLLIITPALLLLARHFAARLHQDANDVQENTAAQQEVHSAAIGSYRTVRMFGFEGLALQQLMRSVDRRLDAVYTLGYRSGKYGTLSRITLSIAELLVLMLGGYAVMTTSLTLGSLMAYMTAYWMAVSAVQTLIDLLPDVQILRSNIWRLADMLDQADEVQPPLPIPAPGQAITWQNAAFGQGEVPTLTGVNLDVPSGSRVLIRGANGAGKSTLALTALSLLPLRQGSVSRVKDVSGLVEPVVFPALPLKDLTTQFDGHDVQAMAEPLGLLPLMNARYDELSLGQRKKFALMMTLLKPAELYVFDEPLANLDDATQVQALEMIMEHTQGKTVLAIMHDSANVLSKFDIVAEVVAGSLEVEIRPEGSRRMGPVDAVMAPLMA
ncbi:ABC transporter transmembrane domain-containing protein [Deinococcus marmoris]|uniref:ABC transporter ATP-binding protein n=1 Tax=Deinococcus marmoris TaxID=249408 RepID=A0A1U7NXA1_9DEIO|nr:ABC transporter ATP-binding protein [Deinococcus marmoris]OLV17558.1 ABC transporter ATP-binding protein [Deinococcus marmoris]